MIAELIKHASLHANVLWYWERAPRSEVWPVLKSGGTYRLALSSALMPSANVMLKQIQRTPNKIFYTVIISAPDIDPKYIWFAENWIYDPNVDQWAFDHQRIFPETVI